MKKLRKWILNGLLLLLLQAVPRAAITGQWDFNSNLDASIGQPILFWDAPTEAGSEFGTTTSFGIPDIDGEEAQVMKFPKTTPFFGGYGVPTGAAANGGGAMVNQYTIVMDVLFPEESSDKRRALVNTDGYDDAEYAVQAGNGLGVGTGSSDGVILPNTWHRIAYAVDLSASPSVVDKYIDGVKVGSDSVGGLDSQYGLLDMLYLFVDDTDETEPGYINSLQIRDEKLSDVLIGVLGGAKAEGILTGPPPNPYITSISPSPDTARLPSRSTVSPTPEIRIEIKDGESKVDETSIVLRLDDIEVTPEIVRDGSDVTITYTPDELLEPLSVHAVGVSFTDDATPPNNLGAQWQFAVGPFSPVAAEIALPLDTAGPRGFVARTVQGPPYIMEVNNPTNLAATVQRGIQQLNGTLRDIEGELVQDESAPGPNPGGTYSVEGGLNHSTDEEVGHFLLDAPFPGIPGTTFHSTQFTTELIGFLELEAGVHKLGVTVNASRVDVNDDDNFALFIGQNPRDAFSHMLGSYVRMNAPAFDEDSQNDNEFTFYIPETGLYPVRLVYVQSGRKGSLELYSFDEATGEKVLVNDPADARAIKSYQNSTSPRAGAAYIAELSPQPGTSGNDPAAPVRLLIQDDRTELDPGTLGMTFNGDPVTPEVTKTGSQTTVIFEPDPNRTNPENEITLSYADNASTPNEFTHSWAFNSMVNTGGASTIVRGQWDFEQGDLAPTVGAALEYFDGPAGETASKTEFGTASAFGLPLINGADANVMRVPGDLDNRIGYIMRHGIEANGGGLKVNQYTLIYDVLIASEGPGAAGMLQVDDLNNTSDGDLFWQGGNFGQGQGGYEGTGIFTAGEWHRVAIAVDLSATPPVITKFVDGIKQDDWSTDGLDGRRALQEYAILFADGDADERRAWYVNSIQVREGKLSDGELVFLGGPEAAGIPEEIPPVTVAGQWDFNGNLNATIGLPLEYFDGPGGETETRTEFGTASSFGLPLLDGVDATVMHVPGDLNNQIGYIMRHGIEANGGGLKVNQYTLIWDVLLDTAGPGAAGMLQVDDLNNTSDGDLFWQGGNFGQGQGGYEGTGIFTAGEWHRVAIAVDLSATPPVITKFVDGIKQDDWSTDGLDGRRALQEYAILFADGDADERRAWYVNSIQVRPGKMSDEELTALGTPTAAGIPLVPGVGPGLEEPLLSIAVAANTVTISWQVDAQDFVLEGTATLASPVWEAVADQGNGTATVQADGTARFFRLRK